MVAKRFFYVCAGLLCLALAYHSGARNAAAQGPGNTAVGISVASNGGGFVWAGITANGDTYISDNSGYSWTREGNLFSGSGPTSGTQKTWGQVKLKYR